MTDAEFVAAHADAMRAEENAFAPNETDERAGWLTLEEQVGWIIRPETKDQELDTFRFETDRERREANRGGK